MKKRFGDFAVVRDQSWIQFPKVKLFSLFYPVGANFFAKQ